MSKILEELYRDIQSKESFRDLLFTLKDFIEYLQESSEYSNLTNRLEKEWKSEVKKLHNLEMEAVRELDKVKVDVLKQVENTKKPTRELLEEINGLKNLTQSLSTSYISDEYAYSLHDIVHLVPEGLEILKKYKVKDGKFEYIIWSKKLEERKGATRILEKDRNEKIWGVWSRLSNLPKIIPMIHERNYDDLHLDYNPLVEKDLYMDLMKWLGALNDRSYAKQGPKNILKDSRELTKRLYHWLLIQNEKKDNTNKTRTLSVNKKVQSVTNLNITDEGRLILNYKEDIFLMSKPIFGGENYNFISFMIRHGDRFTITTKKMKGIDKDITFKKGPHSILNDLKFGSELKKIFFPKCTREAVEFRNFLSEKELDDIKIIKKKLNNELKSLKKLSEKEKESVRNGWY